MLSLLHHSLSLSPLPPPPLALPPVLPPPPFPLPHLHSPLSSPLPPPPPPPMMQVLQSDNQSRNPNQELQQRSIEYLKLSNIATTDTLVQCTCTVRVHGRALCLECRVSWVRVPPEAAHFLRKSDYLGCAVLLCLVVCLTLFASLFLPFHLKTCTLFFCMVFPWRPPIRDCPPCRPQYWRRCRHSPTASLPCSPNSTRLLPGPPSCTRYIHVHCSLVWLDQAALWLDSSIVHLFYFIYMYIHVHV